MKYNFQDTSLVIGYIKELLKDFNLPMVPIYTDDTIPYDDRVYIRNNEIVRYHKSNNSFEWLSPYTYNREVINLTKKFTVKSSSYDKYTHRYLGEYLRFLRDKNKIDLMSLYNCFDYDQPARIYSYTKFSEAEGDGYLIDTDNVNYNYYAIPVKFNKFYTVAIDAPCDYDILCCLYNNKFISDNPAELIKQSLKTIRGSKFNRPFSYSTYFDCASKYWQKEKDLVMLLKLPRRINSSITILEGNFVEDCNSIDGTLFSNYIYNDADRIDGEITFKLPTSYFSKLSLLQYNNKISYPFSDRLVEYLIGNVIGPLDDINNNIQRVQDELYPAKMKGFYGIWSDTIQNDIFKHTNEEDKTKGKNERYGNRIVKGYVKDEEMKWNTDYIRNPKTFRDLYEDITCYVDKNVESMVNSLWFTKILFDHNGGTYQPGVSPTNKLVIKYKSALPNINVPVKQGYRLIGYYDNIEGDGTPYYDGKGNAQKEWDKTSKEETLYAIWIKE